MITANLSQATFKAKYDVIVSVYRAYSNSNNVSIIIMVAFLLLAYYS